MPSIAVIGTGPAGLAAAKALLEHGLDPVVFEASDALGGLWGGPGRGAWSAVARTNVSHYGCCFSDFPWAPGHDAFPLRRAVGRYLSEYADAFELVDRVRFETRVEMVSREGPNRFRVATRCGPHVESRVFDHVVVASGFFSTPYVPPFAGLDRFAGTVHHSAVCDTVEAARAIAGGKHVLVVGAAFSGTEAAEILVDHAASVCVTFRHPMWFVPRWVTLDGGDTHHPIDLVMYSRAKHGPASRDRAKILAEIGGDPGRASPELAFDRGVDPPTTMVITDRFLDLVAAGRVAVKRTSALAFDETSVVFADGTRRRIDAVVACTGYTTCLDFLSPEIRATLSFDETDQFMPTLMHRNTFHPDLPGLAFVGHYRGPYFPVMELQSHWIAGTITGELPYPSRDVMLAGVAEETRLRELRPRPQFPFGDYVALADGLARTTGMFPALDCGDPLADHIANGPVIPAHYRLVGPYADRDLAERTILATPTPSMRTKIGV